jgi:hypothetical protein
MRRALAAYKAKGVRVTTPDGPGTIREQLLGGPGAQFVVVLDKPLELDAVLGRWPEARVEEEIAPGKWKTTLSKADIEEGLGRMQCLRAKEDRMLVACQYYPWAMLTVLEPKVGLPVELSIGGFQHEKVFPARFVSEQGGVLTFEAIDPVTSRLFEEIYGEIEWTKIRKGYFSGHVYFVPTAWLKGMAAAGFDPKLPSGFVRTAEPYGEMLEFDAPIPVKQMSKVLIDYQKFGLAAAKKALKRGEMSQREYDEAALRLENRESVWVSLSEILLMYVIPTRVGFDVRPMREDLAEGIVLEYGEEFKGTFQ